MADHLASPHFHKTCSVAGGVYSNTQQVINQVISLTQQILVCAYQYLLKSTYSISLTEYGLMFIYFLDIKY